MPDRTFLLLVDPRVPRSARAGTATGSSARTTPSGRRVDAAYRELAERFPERIVPSTAAAPRRRWPISSEESFSSLPEQEEAKRLLRAALAEGPAHAYLFHGPPGVGKRHAALRARRARCSATRGRVERRSHPDLYVLEPLGDQIRIDPIRELRRDLHMRPFEGERRVYLLLGAHLMNEEAADALLKDLEEPPLVRRDRPRRRRARAAPRDDSLPLPARSRSGGCRNGPSGDEIERRAPVLSAERGDGASRAIASGRLDRVGAAARSRGGGAPGGAARGRRGRSTPIPTSSPRRRQRSCWSERARGRREARRQAERGARGARAAAARGRAARAASGAGRGAGGDPARRSTSSPRGTATSSWSRRARPRWRSTPTGSTSCATTARASGCSAPRQQPSAFARPGDCSRSCSYRPGSPSRRSSFG